MSDRPRWSRIPPDVAKDRARSAEAKVLYGVVWDRAGANGECHPAVELLAQDVGRSARTVKRAMAELVDAQWIERRPAWRLQDDTGEIFFEPGPGRVRTSNRYRVLGGVGAGGGPKVGALPVPKGVGARVGDIGGPRSNSRKKTRVGPVAHVHARSRAIRAKAGEPDGFADFWERYPHKIARARAAAAFAKAVEADGLTTVAAGLDPWLVYWNANGTELKFVPHPTTWLNQERYAEAPPSGRVGSGAAVEPRGFATLRAMRERGK